MTQPSPAAPSASRPTAWAFAAPGAGDNRQLETLVELLGADARWIEPVDSLRTVLADRLLDPGGRRLPAGKRSRLAPPWPDLVLLAGGRSVIDAKRIRHASGGRSRIVCIGRPWAPLAWLDRIVTTPQYRLPSGGNVIVLPLPLNQPPTPDPADKARLTSELQSLPRPLLGVLLGGDSGSFRFTASDARALSQRIREHVKSVGGGVVVIGSPRTPASVISVLESELDVPARVFSYGRDSQNPYASLLGLADSLLVTGDSASMLAEAIYSGRPVEVFDLSERLHVRIGRMTTAVLPLPRRLVNAAIRRGLWIPPRDLSLIRRVGEQRGWCRSAGTTSHGYGSGNEAFAYVSERAVSFVRELLGNDSGNSSTDGSQAARGKADEHRTDRRHSSTSDQG
jgi:hypothetical protein